MPWVKKLFQRFAAMYGDKLPKMWRRVPEEQMHAIWAEDLCGFSGHEIVVGLNACKQREWPPTLPEFMKMCRPWMNPEVAYHEAVAGMACRRHGDKGQWSHPAIYWAAVNTGSHNLLNSTYTTMKARWERAFSDELAKDDWHPVPDVHAALPAPGQTRATRAQIDPEIAKMVESALKPKRDPKAWAKTILAEQEKKGGRRHAHAVLIMAKRALGIELAPGEV
ncbi:hypothetical protein L540_03295 [Bordetella pseudohinzii]|nr:hypothetical protein L540_03295 [Bordetella pseudohinzii]